MRRTMKCDGKNLNEKGEYGEKKFRTRGFLNDNNIIMRKDVRLLTEGI